MDCQQSQAFLRIQIKRDLSVAFCLVAVSASFAHFTRPRGLGWKKRLEGLQAETASHHTHFIHVLTFYICELLFFCCFKAQTQTWIHMENTWKASYSQQPIHSRNYFKSILSSARNEKSQGQAGKVVIKVNIINFLRLDFQESKDWRQQRAQERERMAFCQYANFRLPNFTLQPPSLILWHAC